MIDSSRAAETGPIRSTYADDGDFFELLELFAESLPEKRLTVRELQNKGEIDELRVWAHQLKGASGGYGFLGLSEAAAELEQGCQAGETDRVTRAVDRIVDYLNRIEI
jgi:histidine phosphotransfer protein HptB